MKLVIVGASGLIGKHVVQAFGKRHEIITAGSKSGDLRLDIRSLQSIKNFFSHIGEFDALVSVTGKGHFGALHTLNDTNFRVGVNDKLMGQINLVLEGQHYVNSNGSFTLTSGILFCEPVAQAANLSAVNGAIEGFVSGASIELTDNVRINAVSPGVVEEATHLFPYFSGHIPVKMERVAQAYVKCVMGNSTGKIVHVH
jgi:NAD(P)-dependent dehydrogenase (short-subunit alcohol dehydrogenase family)